MFTLMMKDETIQHVHSSFLEKYPKLLSIYDQEKLEHIRQDTSYHIEHLESASEFRMDSIFFDYVKWTDSVLSSRGIKTELLIDCFTWIKEIMHIYKQHNKDQGYYTYLLDEGITILNSKVISEKSQ